MNEESLEGIKREVREVNAAISQGYVKAQREAPEIDGKILDDALPQDRSEVQYFVEKLLSRVIEDDTLNSESA